jgi:hypothetical protein
MYCCSFFIMRLACCCFWRPGLHCVVERPPFGVKSKRIFLSADAAFIESIQPFWRCLKAVLLFSIRWRGSVNQRPQKANPLQKDLLAASLSVLFLLCQSRYVLFLLGCCTFYCCCTEDIAGPVPVLPSPLITGVSGDSMADEAGKCIEICFRVTRLRGSLPVSLCSG